MAISTVSNQCMALSVADRIELVQAIWDSIPIESPDAMTLSAPQKAELDRRVAEHRANPSSAIPWHQVRAKLFADHS